MSSNVPVPGSALITSFPAASGHGAVAGAIARLGLLESVVQFKTRPGDSEAGFSRVVQPRVNVAGSALFSSLFLPSCWSREIRRYRWAHLASPHFFHLVRVNRNLTGVVHDLGYLGPRRSGRSPVGYRYLFGREMALARQLRGIVAVSETTRAQLAALDRDVDASVIHNWVGEEFRPRDREAARRTLGLPLDRKIVLSVGLDIPRKNLDLIRPVLARLGPEYLLVRIGESRRIAAGYPSGTLRSYDTVAPADYPLFFNAADLLIYPSLDEGFGVPLVEAVNSGTPIVASDIPIFREVLGGERHLVPLGDIDRWVEACRDAAEAGAGPATRNGLYRELADHYRPPRARREYTEFFRRAGLFV